MLPSSSSGDLSEEGAGSPGRFRKGHGRQSSLGTTMTSPSTRRRSLENTISMIREAMSKDDSQMGTSSPSSSCLFRGPKLIVVRSFFLAEELADRVASGSESPRSPSSPRNSLTGPMPGSPSPVR